MNLTANHFIPTQWRQSFLAVWMQVRHELLYVSWALMEVAFMTPISLTLMPWARYWPPGHVFLWLLLTMFLPLNLMRFMSLARLSRRWRYLLIFVAFLLTLLVSNSILVHHTSLFNGQWVRDFFHNLTEARNSLWVRDASLFLVITFVWGRGTALLNRQFEIRWIGLFLRVGGLLIAPLIIWLGSARLKWSVAPFLLLFFLAGLTAVSLVRAEELERKRSGHSAFLSPRWVSSIIGTTFLITFLASSLAAIISGEATIVIMGWLTPLWSAVSFTVTAVVAVFTFLALPIILIITQFVEQVAQVAVGLLNLWPNNTEPEQEFFNDTLFKLTDIAEITLNMPPVGKIIVFGLVLAAVFLAVIGLYNWYRLAMVATHTSQNIKKPSKVVETITHNLKRFGFLHHWYATTSIRRVYQQMSRAATANGYPRGKSETPYEYIQSLLNVWPQHKADVHLIIEAYINVRYGEVPETKAELNHILQTWKRLERQKPTTR